MPDFTDVADLIRWHLWWCNRVLGMQYSQLFFPGGDVTVDLRYELGRGVLLKMEIEQPELYEALRPAGVG